MLGGVAAAGRTQTLARARALASQRHWGYVAVVEFGVVLVEAAYLTGMGLDTRRAPLRSALANLASGAAGFGLHAIVL